MVETSQGPWVEVAERVWRCVCEPAGVTIGLVAGAVGCALIDCGSTPAQGAALAASAAAVAGVPATHAVVTHAHWDHWFGLGGVRGVASIGHESLPGHVDAPPTRAAAARLGVRPDDIVVPATLIAMVKAVDLGGGRRLEVFHPGRAHTTGDLVAFVPDVDVLFAGDLIEQSGPPAIGPESDLAGWSLALDTLGRICNERTVIVPGHGEPVDLEFLGDQRARIQGVLDRAHELIDQGTREADALAAGDWPLDPAALADAIPLAYAHWAAKGVVPRTTLPLLRPRGLD